MPVAETWFGIQSYFAITLTLKNKECCLCFFVECLKQRRDFIFSKRYTCYLFILMQIFHTLTTCMSHVLIGSAAAAALKTMKPFNFQRTVETEGFYLKMYMFKMKHWHINKTAQNLWHARNRNICCKPCSKESKNLYRNQKNSMNSFLFFVKTQIFKPIFSKILLPKLHHTKHKKTGKCNKC